MATVYELRRSIGDKLEALNRSAFRRRFGLRGKDREYLEKRGLEEVMKHAAEFIATRLAPAEPPNDGKQTPMRGHPVFVAQHATAACCRGCLAKWHGIRAGHELTGEETAHVLAVIRAWLEKEMKKQAGHVVPQRRKTSRPQDQLKLFLALICLACSSQLTLADSNKIVRVTAIQCHSKLGDTNHNVTVLTGLVRESAGKGAKIIVTPECAVSGYMDPFHNLAWTSGTNTGEGFVSIARMAETVPGPSVTHFSALAKELQIYLCLGIAERDGTNYYNAQVLLGPDGTMLAHHRKISLWPPGDAGWVSAGEGIQTVQTPYGRLGLMICHDFHVLPAKLAEAKVDMVLYSVGWYGPNGDDWFSRRFPEKYVAPNGFAVIAANWSAETKDKTWAGSGHSCVIDRTGKVLKMAVTEAGSEIVIADLSK
ncbi:MAG: hypothetical protein C0404_02010 [Verrucomicrobia bacterium]|nr:hypothetical protein [Verrucomicrobiota bacterium]